MTVGRSHSSFHSVYFVTGTCFRWLHLFELAQAYDCVYKWFNYLKESKKAEVIGYVIMPNHFHIILNFIDPKFDLNKVIGNGKRFIAYEIVNRLIESESSEWLNQLSDHVTNREIKKGQKHRVFEESFDAKTIFTESFMKQKLKYIHMNPVRGKWALAADFASYKHSSASFYETGIAQYFEPVHYKEMSNFI